MLVQCLPIDCVRGEWNRRQKKGLRDRNSPTCTLSQTGYEAQALQCCYMPSVTCHKLVCGDTPPCMSSGSANPSKQKTKT